ncbi:MAG: 16S rRNA (cytosine(1402)-N(4))-methyltransferase [Phycisphaeraceae bacterium]|nr:16S rRNA (cytosine(1402)-N(4))-methyltransferase [Phycisphaeraceae bacterium]
MSDRYSHIPVLLHEVLDALDPRPGQVYADCTTGLGGHALEIARRIGPSGCLMLNDWDMGNLRRAEERIRASLGADSPRSRASAPTSPDSRSGLPPAGVWPTWSWPTSVSPPTRWRIRSGGSPSPGKVHWICVLRARMARLPRRPGRLNHCPTPRPILSRHSPSLNSSEFSESSARNAAPGRSHERLTRSVGRTRYPQLRTLPQSSGPQSGVPTRPASTQPPRPSRPFA